MVYWRFGFSHKFGNRGGSVINLSLKQLLSTLKLEQNFNLTAFFFFFRTETILLQEKYNPAETKEFLRTQVVLQWYRGMVTSGIPPQSDGSDQDNFWLNGDILATYIGIWPLTETKLQTGTTLYAYRTHIGKFLLEIMESLFSQTIMKTAIAQIYLPKVSVK